jgi:hypothetical protein
VTWAIFIVRYFLENENLIGLHGPLPRQIETTVYYAIYLEFRLEPASITARTSGGNLPALGKRLDHALDVVITIRRFLSCASAQYAIAHEKDAHLRHCCFLNILISEYGFVDERSLVESKPPADLCWRTL